MLIIPMSAPRPRHSGLIGLGYGLGTGRARVEPDWRTVTVGKYGLINTCRVSVRLYKSTP